MLINQKERIGLDIYLSILYKLALASSIPSRFCKILVKAVRKKGVEVCVYLLP